VSNGGIIGPPNVPTQELASGVWSLGEQYLARVADIWPLLVPAVVSNADLWLDAADLSTITESSGSVSQWDNKGSLGNFTQATGALQPTTGVSTLNGLNVLDFAGDYLTGVNTNEWKFLHDGTTYVIGAVWKPGATANPNERYGLLGTAIATSDIGFCIRYDDVSSENDAIEYFVNRGVSGDRAVAVVANDVFAPANFQMLTSIADPDNATAADRLAYFINGGGANFGNTNTSAVSTSNPTYPLQIGAAGNDESPLTGSIAELVIVSGADATEGNRQIIRDYLNAKWGVYV
jgi:hypothetical protein